MKRDGCKLGMEKTKGKCRFTLKALNKKLLYYGLNNNEVVTGGKSNIDGHKFPGKYQVIHVLNKNMAEVALFYSDKLSEIAGYVDMLISDHKDYVKSVVDKYSKP